MHGVVKGKPNGEQVKVHTNDAKIKQLHSSKKTRNEEEWCPQLECRGSGVEPTEEKTEVKGNADTTHTNVSCWYIHQNSSTLQEVYQFPAT